MNKNIIRQRKLMKQASIASTTTAVTLIIIKFITYFLTGSMAILSSLFDSIQDAMTSAVNLIAIKHASEPADKHHRFGHGKAQALGGIAQAFIIAIAALFLLKESILRLLSPQPIGKIGLGIVITIIALVLTIILVQFQKYVIKETKSLSIKADMAHYTGDILMNIGVILSMLASRFIGWTWVDALFGIGVALYLMTIVYQIVKDSCKMLMDTEISPHLRKKIIDIILGFPEIKLMHDLKTRQSGEQTFIQCCVHMEKHLTLEQAHEITDKIEEKILTIEPMAHTLIHIEPHLHKATQNDII